MLWFTFIFDNTEYYFPVQRRGWKYTKVFEFNYYKFYVTKIWYLQIIIIKLCENIIDTSKIYSYFPRQRVIKERCGCDYMQENHDRGEWEDSRVPRLANEGWGDHHVKRHPY